MKKYKINKKHFRVAIFGSARIKPNDPRYKLVYRLAKMIAEKEIDIVTGGGPGLMDAASRGHHKGRKGNGSESIGLTIQLPREQSDGYHLDIKKDFERFSKRLDSFMSLSNVVVVAPGGIGTILELFYTWQLIQVKQVCEMPIILLDDKWDELIEWVKKGPLRAKLMSPEDMDPIFCAKTPTQVMRLILKTKEEFDNGGKNICHNLKKYKLK